MATIDLKISGISAIRAELKQLKGELANATDPTQMAKLAEQAGVLSDQLKDANEKVAVFASGSKFEQTSNALGLMRGQIASLDFEGAADSAKIFASSVASIKPAEFANSLKSLGSIIGSVGKAFISFGASLLANPIFLLVAAITAIVAVIGLLLNELGFLQPILEGIGWVFGVIKDAIMAVVQSLKDMLDALGLTTYAAEEFANKQQDGLQKVIDRTKELELTITDRYDNEIRLAKIAGEDTTKAELDKQYALMATMKIRLQAIKEMIAQNEVSKRFNEEEIAALQKLAKETSKAINTSVNEVKAIKAQEAADEKKRLADDRKEAQAHYKQKLADQKAYEEERLKVARQIEDLYLEAQKEGIQKELDANNLKYDRLIADTISNKELEASEVTRLTDLFQQLKDAKAIEIYTKEEEARILAFQTQEEKMALYRQEAFDKQNALDEIEFNKKIEREDKLTQAKLDAEQARKNMAIDSLSILSDLVSAFAGKSEAQQKKAFQVNKAISIAQAVISTYQAAQSAYASQMLIPSPDAPVRAAIAAGFAVASGLAKVAVIARTQPGSGSGGAGGGGSAPSMSSGTSTQQATPNYEFFGSNNNANNQTSAQDVEQNIMVTAVVSETEITGTQNKIKKILNNSAL